MKHLTPGNVQQLAAQAGTPAATVAAGAPNIIQPVNMTPVQANQNQVQNQQDLNGITPNFEGSAARNKRTKLNHIFDQETLTPSAPLMQDQNIPVKEMFASTPLMNRKPFASDDLDAYINKKHHQHLNIYSNVVMVQKFGNRLRQAVDIQIINIHQQQKIYEEKIHHQNLDHQ